MLPRVENHFMCEPRDWFVHFIARGGSACLEQASFEMPPAAAPKPGCCTPRLPASRGYCCFAVVAGHDFVLTTSSSATTAPMSGSLAL